MEREIFAAIAAAVESAMNEGRASTIYIKGQLTSHDVDYLEDTGIYRVEFAERGACFKLWLISRMHNEGFSGWF